jgi:hypothetical protein
MPRRLIVRFLGWGLLLGVAGCSRPALMTTAETASPRVARAQSEGEEADLSRRKPDTQGPGFRFPEDPGGVLLAKTLAPAGSLDPRAGHATRPQRQPPSPRLETLTMPLSASSATIVRLPERPRQPLQPRLITEETLGGFDQPTLPQVQTLPVGGRVRLSSPAASQPLPILGQSVPDRASLEDATQDAATAAALAAPLPRRTTPAPFLRLTLPDPYENRRPVGMAPLPEESGLRAGPLRPPKP